MDKLESLSYAPTPPRDRTQLSRESDGFVLTLPPQLSWAFAFSAALAIGIALMLFVVPNLPIRGRTDVISVVGVVIGLYLLFSVVNLFSSRRSWAVLSTRNGILTVTAPHLFRESSRSYQLCDYKDASTNFGESKGNLALIGINGAATVILDGKVYRLADLNVAARELRTEIKRLDPACVRQELELEVALKELRDALPDASSTGSFEET